MSAHNGTYEPLGEEAYEETVTVKKTRRKGAKRRRGGKAKAALLLGILVLVLALVALAIALPIVLSHRNSSDSSVRSTATAASTSGDAFSPTSFVAPDGWQFPPTNGAQPSLPIGSNLNTGSNVWCYKTREGAVLPGGFLKTGSPDAAGRVQVQSCDSGNSFDLAASNLQLCPEARCQTPVWQAAQQGLIQPALASQQFICQNGQVFLNAGQAQQSFYIKYSSLQPETLVSECTSDNSYWVPNVEMVQCTPDQTAKCNALNLARSVPRGVPIILSGQPGPSVVRAGPICQPKASAIWKATGFTRNRFLWWRLKRVNEAEVTSCRGGPTLWIDVTDLSTCTDAAATAAAGCA